MTTRVLTGMLLLLTLALANQLEGRDLSLRPHAHGGARSGQGGQVVRDESGCQARRRAPTVWCSAAPSLRSRRTETAKPSAGSAIDHVGFSVADIDATMKQLQTAGAKVLNPVRDIEGLFKVGFVEDPWGVKLEIVQDPETPGFHHIHLRVADPEASLKWYVDTFGGERGKLKGRIDAVKYANPNVWLLAQKADDAGPSQGRAIDHLGWAVSNVGAKVADLTAEGGEPTEPRGGQEPQCRLRQWSRRRTHRDGARADGTGTRRPLDALDVVLGSAFQVLAAPFY